MFRDDEAPTPEQRAQYLAGQVMALNAAVAMLIATHPDPRRFDEAFSRATAQSAEMFALQLALQADNGMRKGFSETVTLLRAGGNLG